MNRFAAPAAVLIVVAAAGIPLKLASTGAPRSFVRIGLDPVRAALEQDGFATATTPSGAVLRGERGDCRLAVATVRPEGGDDSDFVARYAPGRTLVYYYRGDAYERRPGGRAQIDTYWSWVTAPLSGRPPPLILLVAHAPDCAPDVLKRLSALSRRER